MNSELTRLLRQAADEPSHGPDLTRVESEVSRRKQLKRKVSVAVAALTIAVFIGLAAGLSNSPPVANTGTDPRVSLLESYPTAADSALEEAVNRGWGLDSGSVRLWGVVDGFRYGVATAESGSQICILKLGQEPNSSIGVVSCGNTTRLTGEGVFAMATNNVPDYLAPHEHLAVVVPDGYTMATFDNVEVQVERNMFVISSAPYPTKVTLGGPRGQRTVRLPAMPNPGDAPRTG